MDKTYKAMPFTAVIRHDEIVDKKEPWENHPAYDISETRYCIVSTDTGEVLDDVQGYGYKTAQKAYACFAYKNRDKSKDKERLAKKKRIERWIKQNESFVRLLDDYAFEFAKGTMGSNDKFDAKFVSTLLKENNLNPDFTAGELLRVWRG